MVSTLTYHSYRVTDRGPNTKNQRWNWSICDLHGAYMCSFRACVALGPPTIHVLTNSLANQQTLWNAYLKMIWKKKMWFSCPVETFLSSIPQIWKIIRGWLMHSIRIHCSIHEYSYFRPQFVQNYWICMKMTTDVNWAAQGALFEFNIQRIVNKNVFLESVEWTL